MKKVLKNTPRARKKLDKMKRVYLVARLVRYGVVEHYFSGKYQKDELGDKIPLVYDYDDHNGTTDAWYLRPITNTTTGSIFYWFNDKRRAEQIADRFNDIDGD